MPGGFGGVAEYGITVRWDKNFLKLIRLLLERREEFALFGGVRFGGTLTADDAFAMGFDHVALAAGAGRPTVLDLPNGLARGVRAASDFLMALQLSRRGSDQFGCQYAAALACGSDRRRADRYRYRNRSLAYYPVQVDKFLRRYEILTAVQGEAAIRGAWDEEEREIAEEFLSHARAIRAERKEAEKEGRAPRILELLQSWGAPPSPTGNGSSTALPIRSITKKWRRRWRKVSGLPRASRRCEWKPINGIMRKRSSSRYKLWMKRDHGKKPGKLYCRPAPSWLRQELSPIRYLPGKTKKISS